MSKQPNKGVKPRAARKAAPKLPPVVSLPSIAILGTFILITVIFFWGHLTGHAFLWEDITEAFYPYQSFAARNFTAGILPNWNPYTFCGMPFVADLQNGVFYPGNQLMYYLSGGNLSSWLAQFIIIIHIPIAMIGAWKLAKGFGIGQWGSLFTGITYGLSAIVITHMMHHNMIYHEALFPWAAYFFYRSIDEGSWFHMFVTGLVLGVMMLSGHPQLTLYIGMFLAFLVVYVLVRNARENDDTAASARPSMGKVILIAIVPIAIGAGIFAMQLLPAQELAGLSERATLSYEKSLEGSIAPGQLVSLITPKFFGTIGGDQSVPVTYWYRPEVYYYWETAIYIGVVGLLLMAVGMASRSLGKLRWFLLGMAVLGLLFALGDSFFVHPILARLPLFNKFRMPTRMGIYLALGGAILAGGGLDLLLRGEWEDDERRKALRAVYIVGGLIVFIGLLAVSGALGGMFGAPAEVAAVTKSAGIPALLIGGIASVIVLLRLRTGLHANIVAPALVLLAVIDLFIFGINQNASAEDPEQVYKQNDAQFAAFKVQPPEKLFRVKMREGQAMLMKRNQGPYSGIMLYEGYNALLLDRRVPPTSDPQQAYDLLNIAYDVRPDSLGRSQVVQRTGNYAYARMLYDVKLATAATSKDVMKSGGFDLGKTVLLDEDPGIHTDGTGTGQARITHYDASRIDVNVTTDKPGIMLLSEIWYPAWKVSVDGQPAKLLAADYSLRGVAVPAGTHTVTMRYESDAFHMGMWVTIVAALVGVAGAVVTGVRRRRIGR